MMKNSIIGLSIIFGSLFLAWFIDRGTDIELVPAFCFTWGIFAGVLGERFLTKGKSDGNM